MNFVRVEKEWETSPPPPTASVPQQSYAGIPSYSVQLQSGAGASAGMTGVHGVEQSQPIRIGRGATPASFSGSGAASLAAPNTEHQPTSPTIHHVSLPSF